VRRMGLCAPRESIATRTLERSFAYALNYSALVTAGMGPLRP
jgi:hypothetical protein